MICLLSTMNPLINFIQMYKNIKNIYINNINI